MANAYSVEDLLEFLTHASERGLMPAATAQALAVAVRTVFGVLSEDERADIRKLDVAAVVKRFTNKRLRDFNPSSLKEYGRRVQRAMDHYLKWREDPAGFSVKTRATKAAERKDRQGKGTETLDTGDERQGNGAATAPMATAQGTATTGTQAGGAYQSSFPIRPGIVVTVSNIPSDLTAKEADRLASFVKMLAVE